MTRCMQVCWHVQINSWLVSQSHSQTRLAYSGFKHLPCPWPLHESIDMKLQQSNSLQHHIMESTSTASRQSQENTVTWQHSTTYDPSPNEPPTAVIWQDRRSSYNQYRERGSRSPWQSTYMYPETHNQYHEVRHSHDTLSFPTHRAPALRTGWRERWSSLFFWLQTHFVPP